MPSNPKPPYEVQPGETAKAFAAFTAYLKAGPDRSIRSVAQTLGKSDTLIGRWSKKHGWVERVAAWESELAGEGADAEKDEVRKMRSRHARIARGMLGKAVERLKGIKSSELSPRDLVAFVTEAAKLERLALGEPTTIPGDPAKEDNPLDGISTDKLEAIELILSGNGPAPKKKGKG